MANNGKSKPTGGQCGSMTKQYTLTNNLLNGWGTT
jgi:hypothetical protein